MPHEFNYVRLGPEPASFQLEIIETESESDVFERTEPSNFVVNHQKSIVWLENNSPYMYIMASTNRHSYVRSLASIRKTNVGLCFIRIPNPHREELGFKFTDKRTISERKLKCT